MSSRAVASAVCAAALAVAAHFSVTWLAAVAVVIVILTALGWARLLDLPNKGGTTVVVAAAGIGAVFVAWQTAGAHIVRFLPVVVAMALVMSFVAEMMRQDGRSRLVESVSGTITGAVVAIAVAGWVATGRTVGGAAIVITAATAVAVAAAIGAIPMARGWVGAVLLLVLAGIAGAAAGHLIPHIDIVTGLVAGLAGGFGVAVIRVLVSRMPGIHKPMTALAAAAVPVSVGGILVFAVGTLLLS
ncbi:MAG: hypothetical protein LBH13_05735 [Cellulomonadaceae bacterium]|nr:hypothetical protein [Cellulomonadaceae bacterium]